MKYHRLGGLNSRHLYLTNPDAGKSKIQVLEDSVGGPLPGLQMAAFSLCWHMTGERKGVSSGLFLLGGH